MFLRLARYRLHGRCIPCHGASTQSVMQGCPCFAHDWREWLNLDVAYCLDIVILIVGLAIRYSADRGPVVPGVVRALPPWPPPCGQSPAIRLPCRREPLPAGLSRRDLPATPMSCLWTVLKPGRPEL